VSAIKKHHAVGMHNADIHTVSNNADDIHSVSNRLLIGTMILKMVVRNSLSDINQVFGRQRWFKRAGDQTNSPRCWRTLIARDSKKVGPRLIKKISRGCRIMAKFPFMSRRRCSASQTNYSWRLLLFHPPLSWILQNRCTSSNML